MIIPESKATQKIFDTSATLGAKVQHVRSVMSEAKRLAFVLDVEIRALEAKLTYEIETVYPDIRGTQYEVHQYEPGKLTIETKLDRLQEAFGEK